MLIPKIILSLQGKITDGKEIVRVVSMNTENDDVQVLIRNESPKFGTPVEEYKIILPIGKALNILGYFKDEIKEVIVEKKDVTLKKEVVVKDEKGETNE